jgi:hypothetical protein
MINTTNLSAEPDQAQSSSLSRRTTPTMAGPLAAMVDLSLRHTPQFNAEGR